MIIVYVTDVKETPGQSQALTVAHGDVELIVKQSKKELFP